MVEVGGWYLVMVTETVAVSRCFPRAKAKGADKLGRLGIGRGEEAPPFFIHITFVYLSSRERDEQKREQPPSLPVILHKSPANSTPNSIWQAPRIRIPVLLLTYKINSRNNMVGIRNV